MTITRALRAAAGAMLLLLALASPARATPSVPDTRLIENNVVIGLASLNSDHTELTVCDLVKGDKYRIRGHWTATFGLSGDVSPRDGQCADSNMHLGFTFHSFRLCEVFIVPDWRCQNGLM